MNIQGFVLHPSASQKLDALLEKPPHAVLLAGQQGIGKTHIARALSAQLLGSTDLDNAAYYREVAPSSGSISIEQIRTLADFFKLTVPGKKTVARTAVLHDADTMGLEAQNALLKLLEEPPKGSVIILTSSHAERLLVTIRSRVQLVHLTAPDQEALTQHFIQVGHDKAAVSAAVLRANGNVAEIKRLLESEAPDETVAQVKQALGGTTYDRLLMVESLVKSKDKGISFVTTLAAVATASLHAAASKTSPTLNRWKDVLHAAHVAEEAYARNGNAKLVLTELMLAL